MYTHFCDCEGVDPILEINNRETCDLQRQLLYHSENNKSSCEFNGISVSLFIFFSRLISYLVSSPFYFSYNTLFISFSCLSFSTILARYNVIKKPHVLPTSNVKSSKASSVSFNHYFFISTIVIKFLM